MFGNDVLRFTDSAAFEKCIALDARVSRRVRDATSQRGVRFGSRTVRVVHSCARLSPCREKSGADPTDHFLVFHIYPDEITLKVLATVCEVLGE